MRTLCLLLFVGVAAASCANKCSGHGQCSTNDVCVCYNNFQGSDCSLRTCPFGIAWADIPTGSNAHNYAECSNRGTCDRSGGLCECFEGFSGANCGRTTCPNDCSGHGTCETIDELSGSKYAGWDAGKARGCKCDGGYSGIDCATRMCPKGDDPLTTEVDVTQMTTTSLQVNEVQNVTVQAAGQPINSGNVTFTFTDLYNSVWTTRPVLLPPAKAYANNQGLLTGTCAAGGSTTICRLVGAPTSNVADYLNAINIDVTTISSGAVEHSIVNDYATANKEVTLHAALANGNPSTAATYAVRGGMKTNAANWIASGQTIYVDGTINNGMYTGNLNAAIAGAATETLFRKGDWVMVGQPEFTDGNTHATSTCLMQIAADYVAAAMTLNFVVDDAVTPCIAGTSGSPTKLYYLWAGFQASTAAYDGATKKVTEYDSATGKLTIDASGTGQNGDVLRNALPGMWIRLFHNNDPSKPYCDMQLNGFDNRPGIPAGTADSTLINQDTTALWVDASSATATTEGGSYLCSSWSYNAHDRGTTKYLGATSDVGIAIIHSAVMSGQQAGDFHVAGGTTETVAVVKADGVATITTNTNFVADAEFMRPGVLLYLMHDNEGNAQSAFYCACVISVQATAGANGVVKCTAPPTIAGVSPTSCASDSLVTLTATAGYRIRLFGQNSLRFAEVDANNPNRFQYHQVGDTFRISNVDNTAGAADAKNGRPSSSAEYEISHIDPATASESIFFKYGSKPNGGGMYPVMNVMRVAAAAWSATASIEVTGTEDVWLPSTVVVQPSRAGKAWAATTSADTWAMTDTATTDSAKDVKRVLEELPNQVIESVDVAMTSNTVGLYAYSITFTGGRNSGNQNEIMMNAAGCNTDGCQPRYTGVAIQRASFFDDLVIAAGAVTSADHTDLSTAGYLSALGSETMLFYQNGGMDGLTAPNMYTTTSQVTTDGTTTAVTAAPTSLMILRNKGDHSDTDKSMYFKTGTYEITRGTKESLECAGRGTCEEGLCACYDGFTGEACATMTVLT